MYNKVIKIGVIIDENPISAWKFNIIQGISQLKFCEISQIICINNEERYEKNKNIFQTLFADFENIKKIENPSSFDKQSLNDFSEHIYLCKINTLNNELIVNEEIKNNFDLIINLSYFKINYKIFKSLKFGIWYFKPASKSFKEFSGMVEILNNIPVIKSDLLCITNNEENEKILARCFSPTNFLSIKRSSNIVNWNKSKMILSSLEKLFMLNKLDFYAQNQHMSKDNDYSVNTQNNNDYVRLFLKIFQKSISSKFYNRFYFDQWGLMFNFENKLSKSFSKFQLLKPEKDRFWADPFIIFEDDLYHIFLEEFIFSKNLGHIIVLQMNRDGSIKNKRKILERPYHLSYPFVFKFRDQYYMIPETHSNHTIELYKSIDFPFSWKFCKNLMNNIDAVDTTLFYHKEKWWLFTSVSRYNQIKTWDDLYLFYSDNPLSDLWKAHPSNPIVSDIRKSRSAGNIFLQNSEIIRPSQDNSKGYGSGIVLNRIDFNEKYYNESVIENLQPNWNSTINGLHTIQHNFGLTMIDVRIKRRR